MAFPFEKIIDIRKQEIKYSIVNLNIDTTTKDYLVFVIINSNNKTTTHQLIKSFHNKKNRDKYIETLHKYITNSSNEEIINKCYSALENFPRKNIFTKIYT